MNQGYGPDELADLFALAEKFRKGGMSRDAALAQAKKERPPRRPAVSAPPKPPGPKTCARCGKPLGEVYRVGSLTVGACGHPLPKDVTR